MIEEKWLRVGFESVKYDEKKNEDWFYDCNLGIFDYIEM